MTGKERQDAFWGSRESVKFGDCRAANEAFEKQLARQVEAARKAAEKTAAAQDDEQTTEVTVSSEQLAALGEAAIPAKTFQAA